VLTADLVLVGYKEGKGKFAGTVGALILKSKDGGTDVSVSGMTDEEREYFHLNREALLGSVIEVRFQRYESRGGMRHPAFVRIREDKNPESAD
jgi:DNA ligase-1